jgi:hypothetical protein
MAIANPAGKSRAAGMSRSADKLRPNLMFIDYQVFRMTARIFLNNI